MHCRLLQQAPCPLRRHAARTGTTTCCSHAHMPGQILACSWRHGTGQDTRLQPEPPHRVMQYACPYTVNLQDARGQLAAWMSTRQS